MRDFQRLRRHLHGVLFALPIAACGPSSSPPSEEPITNESNEPDPTPVVQDAPWPLNEGCGTWGSWCGSASQVAAVAVSQDGSACAPYLYHDGLSFTLDTAATQTKQGAGEMACCYSYSAGCDLGRPLLDRGAARVAPVRDGGAWARRRGVAAAGGAVDAMPAALRAALARGWLDDALLEHASVASFARATLELLAVGAPADLIAGCQRAGLDEVRHAEGCFGLVERYLGRRVAPGPIGALPQRAATLERVAVDTFVEGCVAETVATLAATRVLGACRDPEVAALLRRIVRDETRHAALAWRTVAWAIREGGPAVTAAVRAAAAPPASEPAAEPDPILLAHGRLDERTRREARADAWREIILPTLDSIS